MSTNISAIMYELEQAGIPKERVSQICLALIVAGQQSMVAARTEQGVSRLVGHAGEGVASEVVTILSRVRS